ncbi:MAG: N-(5'-phosphoribosyl)anthranilate isomerase [Rhodobacter sp.]|nr:N-(5'-phosphoribosyl)anthranilate isomerase [Rhodobacter sp.]MCA3454480.1 N-(5'-phosphoribosyl)anthranilate isomerase [Rhodobacter sp.]MCA3458006.1 N-(5'-phosphoribosyl)anthranilate isomerase [Rhodobacter sp.]MCA3459804.1 N-(5'-phosphoribosyl)anthranilate isomerase [Rhodobacter sp.]MCA3463519.1 N-(5'-phosphoribosyl)anthranilate isomerase [Rhodobacter sp.]
MPRQDRGMETIIRQTTAAGWIAEVFGAKSVARGGVIRRDLGWIDREIGRERFIAEVRARGFHLIETGGQWIVICNTGFLRVIC